MTMPACVSVIMPVRDGGRWIGEAIASLTAQSFTDFELLIVDDGSADDTAKIIDAAARRDPRIRPITQPPSGVAAALNRGLDAARGRLIARLDADDRAHPARLERQVAFLAANPAIGLVGSWADVIDESGAVIGRLQPPTEPATLARTLAKRNPMLHASVMWRAELTAADRYRVALEGAEDYDLWLRLAERIALANIPEALVQYRRHLAAVTQRDNLRQLFSARLARRAAHARRTHGTDPATALTAPPDWNDAAMTHGAFRDDALLFRFLELAAKPPAPAVASIDLPAMQSRDFAMTHDERRLAQLAMLNVMTSGKPTTPSRRLRLLYDFVRLHPARAIWIGASRLATRGHKSGAA